MSAPNPPEVIRCIWDARDPSRPPEHVPDGDHLRQLYRCGLGSGLAALMVSSIDGSSSLAGLSGGLSSTADQWHMDIVRSSVDAVVIGVGTLEAEGYGPFTVSEESTRWRRSRGLAAHPVLVVVSGSAGPDPAAPYLRDAPVRPLVVTGAEPREHHLATLTDTADVVRLPGRDNPAAVDPAALVSELHRRGLHPLSTEGGPTWLGSAASAGTLSDVLISYSPALVGGSAARIVGDGSPAVPSGATNYELRHTLLADSLLMCWYRRT